jgi:hypothetical protein
MAELTDLIRLVGFQTVKRVSVFVWNDRYRLHPNSWAAQNARIAISPRLTTCWFLSIAATCRGASDGSQLADQIAREAEVMPHLLLRSART